jgi:hypothetical protein
MHWCNLPLLSSSQAALCIVTSCLYRPLTPMCCPPPSTHTRPHTPDSMGDSALGRPSSGPARLTYPARYLSTQPGLWLSTCKRDQQAQVCDECGRIVDAQHACVP